MSTNTIIVDNREISCGNINMIALQARRAAGESLGKLAKEVGLPWQRLWGLLKLPLAKPSRPARRGPLTEAYRPRTLDDMRGQDWVVSHLRAFASNPHPQAFLFLGGTGTGKTSAALALAEALGCDVDKDAFGGVYTVASGEQSAETVRDLASWMNTIPWHGSGWKVIIVNEADRISRPAEMIWLDQLENLPARTVVVFTTNDASRLSARFCDRCISLEFDDDAERLGPQARAYLREIATGEGIKLTDLDIEKIIADSTNNDRVTPRLSFRRVVQRLAALNPREEASHGRVGS